MPYMEGVKENVYRVMKKCEFATAMHPNSTLRCLLVHSNSKVELAEKSELIYQTPLTLKKIDWHNT